MKNILNACRQVVAANWALLAIVMVSLIGVAVAGEFMVGQRQAHQDATGESARCQAMARQILTARGTAPAAAPSGGSVADDSAEIGSAASAAGIVADDLDRIEHDGAERLGSSPYVRGQTGISLKGVSLPQVVAFLDELKSAPVPLLARSLRLSPADQSGARDVERWDVTLSLVSVRYAPANGQGAMARASAGRSAVP